MMISVMITIDLSSLLWQQRSVSHVFFRLDKMTRIAEGWDLRWLSRWWTFESYASIVSIIFDSVFDQDFFTFYNLMPLESFLTSFFKGNNITANWAKSHHKIVCSVCICTINIIFYFNAYRFIMRKYLPFSHSLSAMFIRYTSHPWWRNTKSL